MSTPSSDEDTKRIEVYAAQIGEYFDSVRIIATRHLPQGETRSVSSGDGNVYAQIGAVREWLLIQDERARIEARKEDEP